MAAIATGEFSKINFFPIEEADHNSSYAFMKDWFTHNTWSRASALERLAEFVPKAGADYARLRNYDLGASHHLYVSALSPFIRHRVITETEVLSAILAKHSPQVSEKFVQEVLWRAYWKGWLEMRPSVWTTYQADLARLKNDVQTQSGLRQEWEQACLGQTGIDCFDAWAHELVTTGYLHNHARMWFASIWIYTLNLPWQLGADFFLRHLLDGDPASNTLGWRWVGGLQTVGKTYLARPDNIEKFTKGRFSPSNLATIAPPLSGPPTPERQPIAPLAPVDTTLRTGLLLHDEEMHLGHLLTQSGTLDCAAYWSCRQDQTPWDMSDNVMRFIASLHRERTHRYSDHFDTVQSIETAQDVIEWANQNGLEQIVLPYAAVGPTRTAIEVLKHRAPSDLKICEIRTPYDDMTWPHATHGFFRFKEKIPSFLTKLGI